LSIRAIAPEYYQRENVSSKAPRDVYANTCTPGLGYWIYRQAGAPEVFDGFWQGFKFANDGIINANELGGGVKLEQDPNGAKGYLESEAIFSAVMNDAEIYNIFPESKREGGTAANGYNVVSVLHLTAKQPEEHQYLFSFDVEFSGNYNRFDIAYHYITADDVGKYHWVTHSKARTAATNDVSGKKRRTVLFNIPAGGQLTKVQFRGKKELDIGGSIIEDVGDVIYSDAFLAKVDDVEFHKFSEIPLNKTIVGAINTADARYFEYYHSWQTNNGVLLKMLNSYNIYMYGNVWFKNLEPGNYMLVDPLERIVYKSPSNKILWTTSELETGINIRIRPQSGKWIVASILNKEIDLTPQGFTLKSSAELSAENELFEDNWQSLGALTYYKSLFKNIRKVTNTESNVLKNEGFEFTSLAAQSDWVLKTGNATITYVIEPFDSSREPAAEGEYYLSLNGNSAISQNVDYDFSAIASDSSVKVSGFYRAKSGSDLYIDIIENGNTHTIPVELQPNNNIWTFFTYDVKALINGANDVEIVLRSGSNSVELDRVELAVATAFYGQ
jgi:hypothetical protein